jgi:ABC-type sugar transport system ATPase subunit
VLWDNKVVLLDEPTAALGVAQTHEVLELVKRLRDEGQGVVIISHNLADVFEVADRITVLRLGRYVGTYDAKRVGREQLVGLMTGAVPGIADDDDIDPTAAPGTLGAIVVPTTAPAVTALAGDTPEPPTGPPPAVPPAAAPPPTGSTGSTEEDAR